MTSNQPIESLRHLLDVWKTELENRVKKANNDEKIEHSEAGADGRLPVWGNLERDLELVAAQVSQPAEGWAEILSTARQAVETYRSEGFSGLFDLLEPILGPLNRSAARKHQDGCSLGGQVEEAALVDQTLALYQLIPSTSISRCYLLGFLGWLSEKESLSKVVQCLVGDPPINDKGVPLLFAPLIKRDDIPVGWLFPKLFEGIAQPDLGTAIIDFANFLYRQKELRPHPAAAKLDSLSGLLASATQHLLSIEQDPRSLGEGPEKVSKVINESVGLITALCDAMALVGDKSVVGRIFPALQVTHRRVKLEAAAALAKLGEEDGQNQLIELVEQAVVRRRVVEYAKELGIDSKIDQKYKTPSAMAETELALWLAHPSQMSVAPYKMEVVDSRQQFWPGYEQPVECFLLKYIYPFQPNAYENVGLVGPITHSFSVPIGNLPPEDIYAVFAGWQVQHEEIFAGPVSDASIHQQGMLAQLRRRIEDQDLEILSEDLIGSCLGQWALVGRGKQPAGESGEDREGWIVADQNTCFWLPVDAGFEGFDENFAWFLYLGRKLLNEFNGPGTTEDQG